MEELGLDYSLVTVDLAQGGQCTDLGAGLNPSRKVPILRWDDYTLWESNAILVYLGEHSLVDCGCGPMFDALSLAGDDLSASPAIDADLRRIRSRQAWRACASRS